MNSCKPEQVGTKEHGKMLKLIQVLEDGRVPAKEARNWKIERKTRRSQGKNTEDCGMSSKREDSWHRKAYVTRPEKKCCKTEVPKEEGDIVR